MKKTESIEKDALTEMMSPSVSPSAARDAEVKKSVELALQDYTPKNGIADTVIDKLGSGGVGPQRLAVCPKV